MRLKSLQKKKKKPGVSMPCNFVETIVLQRVLKSRNRQKTKQNKTKLMIYENYEMFLKLIVVLRKKKKLLKQPLARC